MVCISTLVWNKHQRTKESNEVSNEERYHTRTEQWVRRDRNNSLIFVAKEKREPEKGKREDATEKQARKVLKAEFA